MKIAIYGINRSGKTTFINNTISLLSTNFNNVKHIKPSRILFRIANEELNVTYFHTTPENMNFIHKRYVDEISINQSEIIFFDCHAAYYDNDWNLINILSDIDRNQYDKYIYMKTPIDIVLSRIVKSEPKKRIKGLNLQLIERWQNYEIQAINDCLNETGKELEFIEDEKAEFLKYTEIRELLEKLNYEEKK